MMVMMKKCLKCGHKWEAKRDYPLSCPRCKRYDWNLKTKRELNPSSKKVMPHTQERNWLKGIIERRED